jgi:tRNA nucleotidyltransferase (CCA-adding enzyme)
VKYVNKKMRNEKILNDVRLAKAFCHANKVYGAESYVKGFSGYGLELLILHYKSFLNFIKSAEKIKDKAVIDIEKQFRRKQDVLMDVNEAKLNSPIILIDPTCKNRNVLAALSYETFEKFRKISREFLKNPNAKFFETKTLDFDRERIKSKNKEFAVLELKTDKQTGDIAGTKLLKFFNHLAKEIEVYFKIKNKDFEYYNEDYGKGFFIAEKKKDVVKTGPFLKMKNEVQAFKKINKNTFVKKNRIYAKEKIDFSLREFLNNWAKKYSKIAKEMSIIEVKVY